MLFYTMLNSEKNHTIKKILLIMPGKLLNDHFALMKCRILHIENLTSNMKISGIKLSINIVRIIYLLHTFLKYEINSLLIHCHYD